MIFILKFIPNDRLVVIQFSTYYMPSFYSPCFGCFNKPLTPNQKVKKRINHFRQKEAEL